MIRTLLADDEKPAIERLRRLLAAFPDIEILGEAHDGLAALEMICEKKPDLIFLDIDMPELSGLDVARTIDGPAIIFVTAYDEYALAAFEANAIDYLVKPVSQSRLERTIGKIRNWLTPSAFIDQASRIQETIAQMPSKRPRRLAVRIGSRFEVFDPQDVVCATAQDHYTRLTVGEREHYADDPLDRVLERLDPDLFLRVHRSAAINLRFLKELRREGDRKYVAVMNNSQKTEIPISRERLSFVREALGLD